MWQLDPIPQRREGQGEFLGGCFIGEGGRPFPIVDGVVHAGVSMRLLQWMKKLIFPDLRAAGVDTVHFH